MTRTRAWATAAIVTISLVGLVLLIGASTGNLGFHGRTADANLASSDGNAARNVQSNALTVSFSEAEGEDDDSDHEREHADEDEGGEDD